jgi:hypothetical protein
MNVRIVNVQIVNIQIVNVQIVNVRIKCNCSKIFDQFMTARNCPNMELLTSDQTVLTFSHN